VLQVGDQPRFSAFSWSWVDDSETQCIRQAYTRPSYHLRVIEVVMYVPEWWVLRSWCCVTKRTHTHMETHVHREVTVFIKQLDHIVW